MKLVALSLITILFLGSVCFAEEATMTDNIFNGRWIMQNYKRGKSLLTGHFLAGVISACYYVPQSDAILRVSYPRANRGELIDYIYKYYENNPTKRYRNAVDVLLQVEERVEKNKEKEMADGSSWRVWSPPMKQGYLKGYNAGVSAITQGEIEGTVEEQFAVAKDYSVFGKSYSKIAEDIDKFYSTEENLVVPISFVPNIMALVDNNKAEEAAERLESLIAAGKQLAEEQRARKD